MTGQSSSGIKPAGSVKSSSETGVDDSLLDLSPDLLADGDPSPTAATSSELLDALWKESGLDTNNFDPLSGAMDGMSMDASDMPDKKDSPDGAPGENEGENHKSLGNFFFFFIKKNKSFLCTFSILTNWNNQENFFKKTKIFFENWKMNFKKCFLSCSFICCSSTNTWFVYWRSSWWNLTNEKINEKLENQFRKMNQIRKICFNFSFLFFCVDFLFAIYEGHSEIIDTPPPLGVLDTGRNR